MPPSAPATSAAEEERAPSSKPGRHCGPSPHTTAYSRPTTTPSVRSAAPSSTASSASEPSPNTASTELRDCSQHTPPAACNNARCSPTSPTPSPPTPAATQCHYSPEPQPTERLPQLCPRHQTTERNQHGACSCGCPSDCGRRGTERALACLAASDRPVPRTRHLGTRSDCSEQHRPNTRSPPILLAPQR